jgi:hypothetical protein
MQVLVMVSLRKMLMKSNKMKMKWTRLTPKDSHLFARYVVVNLKPQSKLLVGTISVKTVPSPIIKQIRIAKSVGNQQMAFSTKLKS